MVFIFCLRDSFSAWDGSLWSQGPSTPEQTGGLLAGKGEAGSRTCHGTRGPLMETQKVLVSALPSRLLTTPRVHGPCEIGKIEKLMGVSQKAIDSVKYFQNVIYINFVYVLEPSYHMPEHIWWDQYCSWYKFVVDWAWHSACQPIGYEPISQDVSSYLLGLLSQFSLLSDYGNLIPFYIK